MARFAKGSELDRWARALGASNDDEAMKALARLMAELRTAEERSAEVARLTADAPDPEVSEATRLASVEVAASLDGLVGVYHKFAKHSRGGR